MAISDLEFVKGFCRMCNDGWLQGWHERNGGNLTYRLTEADVVLASSFFDEPREWVAMGVCAPELGGQYFLSTGSGKYMRNVQEDPEANIGIVQINDAGDSYRVVWGLINDAKPTSEFPSHFMNHAVRAAADPTNRIIYHAHTPGVIQMSFILPLEDRAFSRVLWQMMTECVVVFPEGVGVVPWMVPGGSAIAEATSELMKKYTAAVWAHHGLFVSGPDFDTAFGLAHTIEKAAALYIGVRAANGGSDAFLNTISDQNLRDTCKDFNVTLNEEFVG